MLSAMMMVGLFLMLMGCIGDAFVGALHDLITETKGSI